MSRARTGRGGRALAMRLAGVPWDQIGKQLGVSAADAFELVGRSLDNRAEAEGVRYRGSTLHVEIERLDAITRALWPNRANPRAALALVAVAQERCRLLAVRPAPPEPAAWVQAAVAKALGITIGSKASPSEDGTGGATALNMTR